MERTESEGRGAEEGWEEFDSSALRALNREGWARFYAGELQAALSCWCELNERG